VTTLSSRPASAWELRLLRLACAGPASAPPAKPPAHLSPALARTYAVCEHVAAAHSRSFHLATALLPAGKRRAIRALYAVCRLSDDLVDGGDAEAFWQWRAQVLQPERSPDQPVLAAWADTCRRYAVPPHYVRQLLDGLARDLHPEPLLTFDDLAAYAYGVASTVGLMSMHIIGYAGASALPYAIKLGVALQVTNVLRDVGEDWRTGRVYLPRAELAAFGLDEADLAAARVDDRWRAFMRYQVARNRRLYEEAWPGLSLLHADGRLAVAAAAVFYRAILDDIEAHAYDVFSRRAHVGTAAKLRRLPGLWWWSRTQCRPTTM
jgi:phytoene synthase